MFVSQNENPAASTRPDRRWLDLLEPEDLAFLKRFVLSSGSLKDTAKAYAISYPTVRLRLDRLIAKIRIADDGSIQDHFERTLRAAYADGRLDLETMKVLLAAHREALEGQQ
jgi:hypothetical protein